MNGTQLGIALVRANNATNGAFSTLAEAEKHPNPAAYLRRWGESARADLTEARRQLDIALAALETPES